MTIQLLPNPIYIDVLCSQGEKDIRHGEFKIKKTERSGWGSKNESKIVFFDVRKEPILFFARMKIVIVVISNFCENVVISNANFGFSLRPISIRTSSRLGDSFESRIERCVFRFSCFALCHDCLLYLDTVEGKNENETIRWLCCRLKSCGNHFLKSYCEDSFNSNFLSMYGVTIQCAYVMPLMFGTERNSIPTRNNILKIFGKSDLLSTVGGGSSSGKLRVRKCVLCITS